ncbi:hypothetical protein [Cognatiyoonia sp. IB215182]|uniref:hypothetical protein n=1 Tax=Cognatiyoonia sp. IB215182 TaxID=3097353 RepID=UPI002A103C3D|nr:hypothetical protein [Cognatiyoonia sp. IB215182]MDX8354934.1 hypothetical protein [Cognatiyoonia sp. IB215182]
MKQQNDISLFEAAWQATLGKSDPFALAAFEERRKALTARQLAQLDQPFRSRAYRAPARAASVLTGWFPGPRSVNWEAQFAKDPALALLAIHAADGYLRESAVQLAPMEDTAALTALLLRCNDWVEQVRVTAFARLEAVLPKLDKAALIPLCLFALDRVSRWERGGAGALKMLAAHKDWPAAVRATFTDSNTGPLARSLRQLLRRPDYDWVLPDLAVHARSAFVRAVATEALLTGYARWTEGYDWVWHDKVFNLRCKVHRQGTRLIEVSPATRAMVLRRASQDNSAKLRSLAADYLIEVGDAECDDLVSTLTNDNAKSVQWRMAYYHKKWAGNPSAQEG